MPEWCRLQSRIEVWANMERKEKLFSEKQDRLEVRLKDIRHRKKNKEESKIEMGLIEPRHENE